MMEEIEISLFPIPGSVSLPFSRVPLHIFEPRYRKMIQDSVANQRRVGIAHTQKLISPSKVRADADLHENLKSNQETYDPYPIFSAGFAEIIEMLPDGRMIVEITMDQRFEVVREIQQLPYKIAVCKSYVDREDTIEPGVQSLSALRESLDRIFIQIAKGQSAEMHELLESEAWTSKSIHEYSFAIYSLVLFDAETAQNVLELQSIRERIEFMKDSLEKNILQ
jgi:Lon protease-like protein